MKFNSATSRDSELTINCKKNHQMKRIIGFLICVFLCLGSNANDECSTAIELTVNGDNSCSVVYNANVIGATQSFPPCINTGYEAKDVWYKFVATASTHTIALDPESYSDFIMQVYSGSCGNLSSIICINTTGINTNEGSTLNNLVPGDTYFIRVFVWHAWTDIKFQICINSNTSFIPNDEAAGAIQRPTTGGNSFAVYSNIGATLSLPACTGTGTKDIWFKFVAVAQRHIIRYGSSGSGEYPVAVEVFSGTPGNMTSIKCYGLADQAADVAGLTPGNTYYYRIYISNGNSVSTDLYTYIITPDPTK
ncbi:hypothetical protein H7X64_01600, partial [Armatimonadetes bacterium]|nr:hypothetical protein [bacterium]